MLDKDVNLEIQQSGFEIQMKLTVELGIKMLRIMEAECSGSNAGLTMPKAVQFQK